jgi:site-specific recombinase XerD
MKQEKLDSLIDQALCTLSENGLSQITISAYKRYGFSVISEYFKELNMQSYSEQISDELVVKKRIAFENGETSYQEWAALRKCAATLTSIMETGEIGTAVLPKWSHVQNPLRKPIPEEQLGNKDNIFTLAHLTKQEMVKFGFSEKTKKSYTLQGFDPILRNCIQNGITSYSKEKVSTFVNESHNNLDLPYRTRLYIRRVALMLDEYYETGSLVWQQLKPIKLHLLAERFSILLDSFCKERHDSGILSHNTLEADRVTVRQFLFILEDMGHTCFMRVTLKDISECIKTLAKQNPSMSYLSYIRNFLTFLHKQNETEIDLCVAIPRIVPPRTVIQEGFTLEEIDSMLNEIDRGSAIGKRDYAIILLAAQTGLRAVDIADIKFTEIDWRLNTINITQEKTKRGLALSLPMEAGNAIAEYILDGRPKCELPFIFLKMRNPVSKMDRKTVGAIVRRYARCIAIKNPGGRRKGFHGLRRAFGGRLLEAEIPIELLSELLGHCHINSSKPYLSANEAGLKSCALSIPTIMKVGDAL